MKATVELGEPIQVWLRFAHHRIHVVGEFTEQVDIYSTARGCHSSGPRLNERSKSIDVCKVLRRPALHLHAPIALVHHQTLRGQTPQRFSHRSSTDPDRTSEIAFPQPFALGLFTGEDLLAN